jgi:hypothetical protein
MMDAFQRTEKKTFTSDKQFLFGTVRYYLSAVYVFDVVNLKVLGYISQYGDKAADWRNQDSVLRSCKGARYIFL